MSGSGDSDSSMSASSQSSGSEDGGDDCPVSEAWLTSVLALHHESEVHVEAFTVLPGCERSETVLSDILAVTVDYALPLASPRPRHLHIIVKLLPQDPYSRYFVTEAQFDLREIKFYTKVRTITSLSPQSPKGNTREHNGFGDIGTPSR